MDREIGQEELLLLVASGATGTYNLDPIRMMKGAFLVTQIGAKEWKSAFDFKPYDYGPFDPSVYRTIETLQQKDLIKEVYKNGNSYPSYVLSDSGKTKVAALSRKMSKEANWLKGVGSYVTSKSFATLLKEIYTEFPDYAEKSVLRS